MKACASTVRSDVTPHSQLRAGTSRRSTSDLKIGPASWNAADPPAVVIVWPRIMECRRPARSRHRLWPMPDDLNGEKASIQSGLRLAPPMGAGTLMMFCGAARDDWLRGVVNTTCASQEVNRVPDFGLG